MTEILTAAQMRAIEQAAIESGEVTGLELMERAGQGVVEAVFGEWPELTLSSFRAVVLCGPGNNGGDGFVVARLLKEWGWEVEVFLYGDPDKLPLDARVNFDRWCEMGTVTCRAINPPPLKDDSLHIDGHFDLLIDGLFGTGLTRSFGGLFTVFSSMRELLRQKGVRVVAIDMPTGLCSDSGKPIGSVIPSDLTVSFHTAKIGHVLADGPATCGRIVIKRIGIKGHLTVPSNDSVRLIERPEIRVGKTGGHKYTNGHALILSGGLGKTGAARLAARGALRIGAGVVSVGAPPNALTEVAAQITALMLARVDGSEGLSKLLEDKRLNALCLGPGMGVERARELVPVALAAGRATVLDADALTAFADDPQVLFDMLHEACILTPHGGEFSRLFPDIYQRLIEDASTGPAYSKVDATREAAKRAGCVVLFKGPDTVIAAPDGHCSINAAVYDRAAPWLATAGSGDVLAGFITGLLARGFSPMLAAETGAWLHVECARAFGPGLIAEDLPEQIPSVYRGLQVKAE